MTYDKKNSTLIAGIAMILMLIHHLFNLKFYETNHVIPILINNYEVDAYLGKFGKICVGIFVFNTGYVFFSKPNFYDTWNKRFKRLFKFLISYWILCILFCLYGYCINEPLPTIANFIKNLFGITTGGNIQVTYAWYVYFYIEIIILYPISHQIFLPKRSVKQDIFIFIILSLLLEGIFLILDPVTSFNKIPLVRLSEFYPTVIIGSLAAKHNLLSKFYNCYIYKQLYIVVVLIIIITYYPITKSIGFTLSFGIYTLLLIPALLKILDNTPKKLKNYIEPIGIYSMNMWFISSIFETPNNSLQWIAYLPQYTPFVLLWNILLLLPPAYLLSKLQNQILKHISL